jgi:hypothetical protein
MTHLHSSRIHANIIAAAAVAGLLLCSVAARAGDSQPEGAPAPWTAAALPRFQPGLWEYRRTLFNQGADKPQVTKITKCSDPTSDIREKMASLKGKSCQFSAPRHSDDHYVSNWTCQTVKGPVRFHDVLTASDTTTYIDVSEAQLSQRITRSRLEAVRLGDCPADKPGVPGTPGAKSAPKAKPLHPSSATELSSR